MIGTSVMKELITNSLEVIKIFVNKDICVSRPWSQAGKFVFLYLPAPALNLYLPAPASTN